MEKFQSLADFLGIPIPDPTESGPGAAAAPPVSSEPAAAPPSGKLAAKTFAREILNSLEYRQSLIRRIQDDELPPAVECLLYHYAHGKPTENLQIKDLTNRFEGATVAQLEARVSVLSEQLRKIRNGETPDLAESVH